MCGIAGTILGPGGAREFNPNAQELAIKRLRHRGPDAVGQYQHDSVWFGHARLSILDLSSAGSQPMRSADGRYVITYNGEVYNFREMVKTLGIENLVSNSDTEVVLRAFAKLGERSFRGFNGIFAFAIHDREERAVWLVRDRLGVKPLYYHQNGNQLVFASEIKAVLALLGETPPCDLSAMHEWLYYGNSLGGRTLFHGTQQLLPGTALRIDLDSFTTTVTAYWSLQEESQRSRQIPDSTSEMVSSTRDLLEQAVRRQLVSDVPVGVFLSGGIDSSAITAFASRHYGSRISTYSAGFDDPHLPDERTKARRVASMFGTDHHELFIEGRDLASVVEILVDHHGGPFSDAANIPLYLMARQISGETKVVLQGDGGDEVFGGYRRYATLRFRALLHALVGAGRITASFLPQSFLKQRVIRYCNVYGQGDPGSTIGLLLTGEGVDNTLLDVFGKSFGLRIASSDPLKRYREVQAQFASLDIGQQMSMVDLSVVLPDTYLEKVDRATMAHGLEARVPFLDHDLVDFVARIPGNRKMPLGRKKWLLKKALHGVVPDFVLDGPKTGFSVPYRRWLVGPLREHFFDHLTTFRRREPEFLRENVIADWLEKTEHGVRDLSPRLWRLYNFLIWSNRFGVEFDT